MRAQPRPRAVGQVRLRAGEFGRVAFLPREEIVAIRPDGLHAIEIVAAVEPAAPAEVLLVVPLRHRQQRCLAILEYAVDRSADRKALALLQRTIDVPERVVGNLAFQSKRNDLGKIELEPEAGRVAEARPFLVPEHGRTEPAMVSNVRNKFPLMLIEFRGIDVQSRNHRADIAPTLPFGLPIARLAAPA